jgi:undecaprenyl-diphosphatase
MMAFLLVAFIDLSADVWLRRGLEWDVPIMLAVHEWAAPWLDITMLAITELGQLIAFTLGAVGVVWLWQRMRRSLALALAISVLGAGLLNQLLKALFARPRPQLFVTIIDATNYSFPSGHTMVSVGFFGFVAVLLWHSGKWALAMVSLLIPLLVALSRVYLGVHYPSDVLGALAVAWVWVGVVWSVYEHWPWRTPATAQEQMLAQQIEQPQAMIEGSNRTRG